MILEEDNKCNKILLRLLFQAHHQVGEKKNEQKFTPHLNLFTKFKQGVIFRSVFCSCLEDELKTGVFSRSWYLY